MNEGSHKNLFVLIILIALVLAGGYFVLNKGGADKPANGFEGNLISAEEGSLIVHGVYTNDGIPTGEGVVDIHVMVANDIVIQREVFDIPAGGGMFVVNDLPKTASTITLEDMKKDALTQTLGLTIQAVGNISGQNAFSASKITYRIPRSTPTQ